MKHKSQKAQKTPVTLLPADKSIYTGHTEIYQILDLGAGVVFVSKYSTQDSNST